MTAHPAESSRADHAVLHELRADPGRASLENLLRAITNLALQEQLAENLR